MEVYFISYMRRRGVLLSGLEITIFSREPNCIFISFIKVLCINLRNLRESQEYSREPWVLASPNFEPWLALAMKRLCQGNSLCTIGGLLRKAFLSFQNLCICIVQVLRSRISGGAFLRSVGTFK